MTKYYAMYKGDELISHGTKEEIAEATGHSVNYLNQLSSRTARGLQKEDSTQLIEVEEVK